MTEITSLGAECFSVVCVCTSQRHVHRANGKSPPPRFGPALAPRARPPPAPHGTRAPSPHGPRPNLLSPFPPRAVPFCTGASKAPQIPRLSAWLQGALSRKCWCRRMRLVGWRVAWRVVATRRDAAVPLGGARLVVAHKGDDLRGGARRAV